MGRQCKRKKSSGGLGIWIIEKEKFERLKYEDKVYTSNFLDSLSSKNPPSNDEIFLFTNKLALLTQ